MGRSEENARRGSAPIAPIALGLAAGLASGSFILADRYVDPLQGSVLSVLSGPAAAVAGVLFQWAGAHERSARGLFAAAVAERLADATILGSLAWVAVNPPMGPFILSIPDVALAGAALTALGLSYLSAYTRAKGNGLGFRILGWTFEPVVHFGLVGLALLLRAWPFEAAPTAVLWLAAAASAVSVFRAASAIGRQEEPS
jgi:hypothetical protein